jgi:hypothetical protein
VSTETEVLIDDDTLTDRGDSITAEQVEEAQKKETPERDDKGRFVKQDEKAEEKSEEKEEEKKGEAAEEKEEAAEEEEEEEEGETAETEERDDTATKQVPYKRFKELVDQRRELQRELAEARAAATQAGKAEDKQEDQVAVFNKRLDALYEKVEEARASGDSKQAATLQREIDGMNQAKLRAESQYVSRQAAFAAQQNSTYNQMLDYLERAAPVIDPNAADFSKDFVKELEFQVAAYEKMGMASPDALYKACGLLFDANPFDVTRREGATTKQEEKKPPAAKKTDVSKNLEAAKKIPPKGESRTSASDDTAIKAVELSDEEFDKLPESKKRELRGDVM